MTINALTPPFRRLRVFAFDPSASLSLATALINEAVIQLPWEDLTPGPIGEYLEVLDIDPASKAYYEPVDLNQPIWLVQDGMAPAEGNPAFHQQMVYAVAMATIGNFERALGRKVLWRTRQEHDGAVGEFVQRLRIYPHALREANAYYSPQKIALLFGYFRAAPDQPGRMMAGSTVFACLSHDIIAHETAHAILDGLHRRMIEPSNPDVLAFHEAFADLVALFQHFTLTDALRHQIAQMRGDLSRRSLISALATQFGQAIGQYGALRDAIDAIDATSGLPTETLLTAGDEPHRRGAVLVAAVFDAFISLYRTQTADLLRLAGRRDTDSDQDLHPDLVNRLAHEASTIAGHLLRMCVRGLDYLPPVDVTFGDYLRAVITADVDLVPDSHAYRIAIIEAFRRRAIIPGDCRSMSVDNLLWGPPTRNLPPDWLKSLDLKRLPTRKEIWEHERKHKENLKDWILSHPNESNTIFYELGLCLDKKTTTKTLRRFKNIKFVHFEIQSIRVANRVGPQGRRQQHLIVSITQERHAYINKLHQAQADQFGPRKAGLRADFKFLGGATIIADLHSREVLYCIRKNIMSEARLERERQYRFGNPSRAETYFADSAKNEPFAMIHRLAWRDGE